MGTPRRRRTGRLRGRPELRRPDWPPRSPVRCTSRPSASARARHRRAGAGVTDMAGMTGEPGAALHQAVRAAARRPSATRRARSPGRGRRRLPGRGAQLPLSRPARRVRLRGVRPGTFSGSPVDLSPGLRHPATSVSGVSAAPAATLVPPGSHHDRHPHHRRVATAGVFASGLLLAATACGSSPARGSGSTLLRPRPPPPPARCTPRTTPRSARSWSTARASRSTASTRQRQALRLALHRHLRGPVAGGARGQREPRARA